MSNTNEYVNQLITDVYNAQQKRYNAKHEATLNAYPWLKGVRDAQKRLNESEAK